MKAFVIAEHEASAYRLCAGARTLTDEVHLIVLGATSAPEKVADYVARVNVPEGEALENAAATLVSYFNEEEPDMVLAESTARLRIMTGTLAAHAKTSVMTDVFSFSEEGAQGLYFAGVAVRVQRPLGKTAFYTVSNTAFADLEPHGKNEIRELEWVVPVSKIMVKSSAPVPKAEDDLQNAKVVVAVGRGFDEESKLDLARMLCGRIGAGLACSRPLTEGNGWLPAETYVGVSGLTLAPKAYIALGISGQMQHMVGCNRSDTIFAVNKDSNAPIFKQCDHGLVGDVESVLPALVEML